MLATRNIRRGDKLPPRYICDFLMWKLYTRYGKLGGAGHVRRGGNRALIIHEGDAISLSQIFPYFYYRREIERRFHLRLSFLSKTKFLANPENSGRGASTLLLQSWFTTPEGPLQSLLLSAKTLNPNAKIVFLDAMAPTDLRLASVLSDKIDLYVKKHLLRDRSRYGKATRGDTNLTDFYMREYDLASPDVTFPLPNGFLNKILVGPSFFMAPELFGHFKFNPHADHTHKPIDIHARIGIEGTGWYSSMRKEAKARLEKIDGVTTVGGAGVAPREYFYELRNSKMCISPFGYGEVCHRDFEAAFGGALLLKPDMSHIETNPDIFVPYQTYIPLDWRFSNLEEKARYYLAHDDERRRIVDNAYRVLHDYCRLDRFLDQMKPVFEVS